jgi:hypothetical protein
MLSIICRVFTKMLDDDRKKYGAENEGVEHEVTDSASVWQQKVDDDVEALAA